MRPYAVSGLLYRYRSGVMSGATAILSHRRELNSLGSTVGDLSRLRRLRWLPLTISRAVIGSVLVAPPAPFCGLGL